jgi:hypothetical protein
MKEISDKHAEAQVRGQRQSNERTWSTVLSRRVLLCGGI